MAKVKTTEIDDQLSVILKQTKQSEETVKEANKTIDLFKRQMAHISTEIVKMHESKAKELNGLIEANMNTFRLEIKETTEKLSNATAVIGQTKDQAIEEIKKVAYNKMTYTKFTIWILSVAAIMMVIFICCIEMQRRIDIGTLNDAKQTAVNAANLNAKWLEWLNNNPKNKAAFIEWSDNQSKKTQQK